MEDDLFLTEVKGQGSLKHPKLVNVRKDHAKLMEIVEAFGNKVTSMVDRQRAEYMQAYEHHMHDVQKELHTLREKVTEIANDKTRGEKLQQLNADQKFFRKEALSYDEEAAVLRKKIRRLKDTIQNVEKERDWLLKKLREEKRRYNFIKEERLKLSNNVDANTSTTSFSNESYSLELKQQRDLMAGAGERAKWHAVLETSGAINREEAMMAALPHIMSQPQLPSKKQQTMFRAESLDSGLEGKWRKQNPFKEQEKQAKGELVTARARQEAIRDFVAHCSASCGLGMWAKLKYRPLPSLISACTEVPLDDEGGDERWQLAQELALTPETYLVLSDILSGRFEAQAAEEESKELDDLEGALAGEWTSIDLDALPDDDGGDVIFPTPEEERWMQGDDGDLEGEGDPEVQGGGRYYEQGSEYPFPKGGSGLRTASPGSRQGAVKLPKIRTASGPKGVDKGKGKSFSIDEDLMGYLMKGRQA